MGREETEGEIFISYATEDSADAKIVKEWLKSRGYCVWWDQDIEGGESFRTAIQQALERARCAIVIWTPNSVRSDFVINEAEEARRTRRLIPIASPELGIREIPLDFRHLQILRLNDLGRLSGALQRFGIEPRGAIPEASAAASRPIVDRRYDTIGSIVQRMKKKRIAYVSLAAVAVPAAGALLVYFPSVMLGFFLAVAAALIVMLFFSS